MNNLTDVKSNLPEWYTAERETEKTIGRLDTLKELNYYLNNPDEYIRRLAIMRMSKLKLKDVEVSLKAILDNPLESDSNKELAAWTIKASALKWNKDVLLSSRYLSRFTGHEKYDDIFGVSYSNQNKWNGPAFDATILFRGLPAESGDVFAMHNLDIDTVFDVKSWISSAAKNLLSSPAELAKKSKEARVKKAEAKTKAAIEAAAAKAAAKAAAEEAAAKAALEEAAVKAAAEAAIKEEVAMRAEAPMRTVAAMRSETSSSVVAERIPAVAGMSITPGRIGRAQARSMIIGVEESNMSVSTYASDTSVMSNSNDNNSHNDRSGTQVRTSHTSKRSSHGRSGYYGKNSHDIYSNMYRNPGIGAAFKKAIFNFLYVLLFPVRLLNRYKIAILLIIVILYAFINVTPFGKNLTVYYIGSNFWTAQNSILGKVEDKASSIWIEFKNAAGIGTSTPELQASGLFGPAAKKAIDITGKATFTVTATKGLNMRSKPDASSDKVSDEPLKYGSMVIYLEKSQNDSNGKLWHYIMTTDGIRGWASASYLKDGKAG